MLFRSTIAAREKIDMPIVDAVARVLFESGSPLQAIEQLLAREARAENLR